ncbi:MAG: tellurite resistance TerB family protein [Pseudomonadota bacterium]
MKQPLSPEQALIYAMITIAAVDRNISDAELQRIGATVKDLPAFARYDEETLIEDSQICGAELSKPNGLEIVLERIREGLPKRLYETAYALSAEIAATDLEIKAEEVRFLELLSDRLGLDKLTCAALERGARARHQKA